MSGGEAPAFPGEANKDQLVFVKIISSAISCK